MKTFQERIESIAECKVLARSLKGKTPNLTYAGIEPDELQELIIQLFSEDEEVRKFVAEKIENALEDAYCDILRPSEAIEDAIDMRRLVEDDAASRARDMWLEGAQMRMNMIEMKRMSEG